MFQTITKLYAMLSVATATAAVAVVADKGKYIYFGATTIYCDENNVCSIYYPDVPATTMIVSSA